MTRTQIYLDDALRESLTRIAKRKSKEQKRRVTVSELVRDAIYNYYYRRAQK